MILLTLSILSYNYALFLLPNAFVVELVDTLDSGSSGLTAVEVQVLSSAPFTLICLQLSDHYR